MTLPAGTKEYQENHNGIAIQGFSYTESDIQQSSQRIASICFDTSAQQIFNDYMSGFTTLYHPVKGCNMKHIYCRFE